MAQRDGGESGYAGKILAGGQRLLDIINDILDLTEMETGSAGESLIYLSDEISSAVAAAQPKAALAQVRLVAEVSEELPPFLGDGKRIARGLSHLIDNALKFTPANGETLVCAHFEADNTLSVEVRDTGIGMKSEMIQEIFFQQDARLARKHEGIGLGLTYVTKMAELHRAKFELCSEEGHGTVARLTFPRASVVRPSEAA
jgi:signal transduction histidine kinase